MFILKKGNSKKWDFINLFYIYQKGGVMRQRWPELYSFSRPSWDLFNEFEKLITQENTTNSRQPLEMGSFQPRVDVSERETAYLLSFDLPGMKSEDIKIEINDSTLTVSGERLKEQTGEARGTRYFERSFGHFARSFSLPKTVDADNIEANYNDGVLELLIPKKEAAKAKAIEIKKEKASFFDRLLGHNQEGRSEDKH